MIDVAPRRALNEAEMSHNQWYNRSHRTNEASESLKVCAWHTPSDLDLALTARTAATMAAMAPKSHVDSIFPVGTTDDSTALACSAAPPDACTNAVDSDNGSENDWDWCLMPHSEPLPRYLCNSIIQSHNPTISNRVLGLISQYLPQIDLWSHTLHDAYFEHPSHLCR